MLYGIQFLRFVAAALVVAFHTQLALGAVLSDKFSHDILYGFGFGAVGVHIFFVISGFIMVYTQQTHFGTARPLGFLWRRVLRIYPLYWFCAAVTAGCALLLGTSEVPGRLWDWIASLLLIPGHASGIIFVGWTLAYEMVFYIIFAAILALQWPMLRSLIALSLGICVLIGIGRVMDLQNTPGFNVVTSVLLIEFALGAWVAYFAIKTRNAMLGWVCLVLGLLAFAIGLYVGYYKVPRIVSWGLPSALLIYAVAVLERSRIPAIKIPIFDLLGGASYALYLIHPVAIALLMIGFGTLGMAQKDQLTTILIVSLAVNCALSILIYRRVEPKLKPQSNPSVRSDPKGAVLR